MGPRRIVPTLIQRQDAEEAAPEPGLQLPAAPESRPAIPLLADSDGGLDQPGRRIKVDLLVDPTVDLHALIRKSLQLGRPQQDAAGTATGSALHNAPITGVESRRPGGGSTYADVIKSLEARCMAGELSGSEYDSYTHSSQGESSQGSGSANSEQGQGDSDADESTVTQSGDEQGRGSGSDASASSSDTSSSDTEEGGAQEEDGTVAVTSHDEKEPAAAAAATAAAARRHARPVRMTVAHYDPDFIDDSDLMHRQRGSLRTKYTGFFVNEGTLDVVQEAGAAAHAAPRAQTQRNHNAGTKAVQAVAARSIPTASVPQPVQTAGATKQPDVGQKQAAGAKRGAAVLRAEGEQAAPSKKPKVAAEEAGQAAGAVKKALKMTLAQAAAAAGQAASAQPPVKPTVQVGREPPAKPTVISPKPAAKAPVTGTPQKPGGMRAAVKSVSQLVDAIKAKFAPAAPGEGGVANPDGSPAVKPAQAGPRGADALKAAGTRNQIAALAFALFREAGAVDGEQGRRAAASLASAEGGVGEEHILGELSRHLAEAQRTLAAARTEMREFFTTGRAAGAQAANGTAFKPSEAPAGLVEILSRLITAHRRLYGAHKDQDVLQEVADLDPTKGCSASLLQQWLEKSKANTKEAKGQAGAKQQQPAPVTSPNPAPPPSQAATVPPAQQVASKEQSRAASVPVASHGQPSGIPPTQAAGARPVLDLQASVKPADVPMAVEPHASGAQHMEVDAGGESEAAAAAGSRQPQVPPPSLSPAEDMRQVEEAVAAAVKHGGNEGTLRADFEALASGPARAALKALCFAGPQGLKPKPLTEHILAHNYMPSWQGATTTASSKSGNVSSALASKKAEKILVHIGGNTYAWHAFPGVAEKVQPRPQKPKKDKAPLQPHESAAAAAQAEGVEPHSSGALDASGANPVTQ